MSKEKSTETRVQRCKYQATDGSCTFNLWNGRDLPSLARYSQDPRTSLNSPEFIARQCLGAENPNMQKQRCAQYDGSPITLRRFTSNIKLKY